jgi:hypothetical protein
METKELLLKVLKYGLNDLERALQEGSQEKAVKAIEYVRYHLAYLELALPYIS